jgi:hypothetical protein
MIVAQNHVVIDPGIRERFESGSLFPLRNLFTISVLAGFRFRSAPFWRRRQNHRLPQETLSGAIISTAGRAEGFVYKSAKNLCKNKIALARPTALYTSSKPTNPA